MTIWMPSTATRTVSRKRMFRVKSSPKSRPKDLNPRGYMHRNSVFENPLFKPAGIWEV